jgi:uncharacterized protein (DUF3820 family)
LNGFTILNRRNVSLFALRRSLFILHEIANNMHHEIDRILVGFSPEDLLKLARRKMPFGRYQGYPLIDLPEEYLFWFTRKGFPEGELGLLMKFCLDLKIEGLDSLVKPLK